MSQEHTNPLYLLSDDARSWLAGTMDRNRATFAGWSMDASGSEGGEDGGEDTGGEDNPADNPNPADEDPKDPDPDPDPYADKGDEDKRVQKANKEAQRYRTELRTLQDEQKSTKELLSRLTKALTGESDKDTPADPKELASRIDQLTGTVSEQATHLAVYQLAPKAGGNAVALLDSRQFAKSIAGLDPEKDGDKITAAIKKAVDSNAAYRLTQGSASGGGDIDADKREDKKAAKPDLASAIAKRLGK